MVSGLLQPGHLLVLLVIVLVLFGPGKLPELGGALGNGMRELTRALDDSEPPVVVRGSPRGGSAGTPVVEPRGDLRDSCQYCSAAVRATDRYCTRCGHQVNAG
jgi:sec-independent protein translocase protein TatA